MEQKEFKSEAANRRNGRKQHKRVIVNLMLLMWGVVTTLSGLIIQCRYHLQKSPGESIVFGLNRGEWKAVHVWASVCFLLIMLCHVWAHRKWYGQVFKRKLLAKHRPTIALTVLTLAAVISGFIPFFIGYLDNNAAPRLSMIEIHDKIALVFLIVVFRHTMKRHKWYVTHSSHLFR